MNGPSLHLSWDELACRDRLCSPYPHAWRADRAVALATVFEELRARVGLPLVVLSAYRTREHNKLVGGARHSEHVQGRALDLLPPKGWTPMDLAAVAAEIAAVKGLGVYQQFVHVDIRPTLARAVWSGSGSSGDVEAFR